MPYLYSLEYGYIIVVMQGVIPTYNLLKEFDGT